MYSAAAFGCSTVVKKDVSPTKSLALHFKSAVRSLVIHKGNNGPNVDTPVALLLKYLQYPQIFPI